MEPATLHELTDFLRQNNVHPSYAKLLQAVQDNTTATEAAAPPAQDAQADRDNVSQWKRDVCAVVQAIIEPDDLDWMGEEEDIDEVHFVERALSDVESRFERQVLKTTVDVEF